MTKASKSRVARKKAPLAVVPKRIDWSKEDQWVGIPAQPFVLPDDECRAKNVPLGTVEEPTPVADMPMPGSPFIAIAVPCMDFVDTEFSLAFALQLSTLRTVSCLLHTQSAYIDEARQSFVDQAKRRRVRLPDGKVIRPSHLMQFDSDMTFPSNTVQRLLSHNTKDVVGCVYSRRVEPFTNIGLTVDRSIEKIENDHPNLVDMVLLPTGIMLIHMSVFDRMPECDDDGPAFGFRWMPEIKKYEREDVRFCRLVREAGMHVWCDVPLSQHIVHVGKATYTVNEAEKRAAREGFGQKAQRDAGKSPDEQPTQPSAPVEMIDISKARDFDHHVAPEVQAAE